MDIRITEKEAVYLKNREAWYLQLPIDSENSKISSSPIGLKDFIHTFSLYSYLNILQDGNVV